MSDQKMSNKYQDILMLDDTLSQDEMDIAKSARIYAQEMLAPRVVEAEHDSFFHKEVIKELGSRRLLGHSITGYGAPGGGHVIQGLIARELERVDGGYRSAFVSQSSMTMYAIATYGNDEQKKAYLPSMISGDLIGAFALIEASCPSDPSRLMMTASKTENGYILNGQKAWITNAPIADVLVVWARREDNVIQAFIVESTQKGFSATPIEGRMSLKIQSVGYVHLDDVFVPNENVLDKAMHLKSALACLNEARYGIAWGAIGSAEFCWEKTLAHVLSYTPFNTHLAAGQMAQERIAMMQTEISLALCASLHVGRLLDKGVSAMEAVTMLKLNNVGKSLSIARTARDLLGAGGILESSGVMRHMINLEASSSFEGNADVLSLILGRGQTGTSAF